MDKHYVSNHKDHAIGREVHVEGWGNGPFFCIQAIWGDTVHLSKPSETRTRHTIKACRCYFTHAAWRTIEAIERTANV
jgi:hypothetical protein